MGGQRDHHRARARVVVRAVHDLEFAAAPGAAYGMRSPAIASPPPRSRHRPTRRVAAQQRLDSLARLHSPREARPRRRVRARRHRPSTRPRVAASAPPAPAPRARCCAASTAECERASRLGMHVAVQSRFDSLADSLEHGLHNYHDRRVDFGQKRLSCTELAYGYRAADEALVSLAQPRRATHARSIRRDGRATISSERGWTR